MSYLKNPMIKWIACIALGCSYSFAVAQDQDDTPSKPEPKSSASRTNQKVDPLKATGRILWSDKGIQLVAPRKMDMSFGLRISSNQNTCTNLVATVPFPMDWPEQKLQVTSHLIPDQAQSSFRDLPAGARQMLLNMPSLSANSVAELVVQVEIEKSFIDPPADPTIFRIPKSLSKELKFYMGNSPYIDCELPAIKKTAKTIASSNPASAWEHVEMIYDWVRETIEYTNGPLRHIRDSLKDKKGDCEEMTGIFVALCRASGIPARCVWIPDHCYPEFYLEDQDGNGCWFPCQAAGDRQFGQMHDYRPILQKGDRFKVPEEPGQQRYVASFFTCRQRATVPGGLSPSVEEVLDLGPLKAELEQLQQQANQTPQGQ